LPGVRTRIGTSGYSYREWRGKFYPADLPASRMLAYYAERLPAVEINNTFYRMPAAKRLVNWAAQVPADFRFVLKASQRITHQKRLLGAARPLASFLRAAAKLGDRLGPLLFQLPPNFKLDLPRLEAFLQLLPPDRQAAFEFRHSSWFTDGTYRALAARNAALCIADADDLSTPFEATAGWGYLRLRRTDYDARAVHTWAEHIRAQGAWGEAWVFFKHEDKGRGPRLAAALRRALGDQKVP
jgi:uncharacterized protein YecE (DUF72 family)